ncbi:MAG: hypothetical protein KF830_06045 [Planctomycetes bacterium]|nr:hypothetical protein [Planctomycetota bacterium]
MHELEPRPAITPPADPVEALVRRHQRGLWRYLRQLGAAADVAEDLLQETFLVALRKRLEDRGATAVGAFLRRTARHLHLRRCRAEGRREQRLAELADRAWQAECCGDDGEAWLRALAACVGKLDERSRRAVERWYGPEGDDRGHLAAELGLRPNGLKTLLQRARATLRQCLTRSFGDGS